MTAVAGGSNVAPESSGGLLAQPASRAADKAVTAAIRLRDAPMEANLAHDRAARNEQRLTPPRNLSPLAQRCLAATVPRGSRLSRAGGRSIGVGRICRQERARNARFCPSCCCPCRTRGAVAGRVSGKRGAGGGGAARIPRIRLQQYLCAEAR